MIQLQAIGYLARRVLRCHYAKAGGSGGNIAIITPVFAVYCDNCGCYGCNRYDEDIMDDSISLLSLKVLLKLYISSSSSSNSNISARIGRGGELISCIFNGDSGGVLMI